MKHQAPAVVVLVVAARLCGGQINALRERLGRNQAEFAELTGIGVATLSRWERGRLLQTRALDRYLRVLDALPQAIQVLESLQKPTRASTTFHLPPAEEAVARAHAARFGSLGSPCPSSKSASAAAPETHPAVLPAEQLSNH